jgi:hypothetical protein
MSSKGMLPNEMVVALFGHEISCRLEVTMAEALEAPANNLFHDKVIHGVIFLLKPNG